MHESTPRQFRIGWDVGGWHCDNNASRDALVVLEVIGSHADRIGFYRGNLRQELVLPRGVDLIRRFFNLCEIEPPEKFDLTIAIDTPLGWPDSFVSMISGGAQVQIPFIDADNPYTRRRTEIEIIRKGFRAADGQTLRPLSPVRDMIGSQATKGIHFLRSVGLVAISPGIFHATTSNVSVTAFEGYPALAKATKNSAFAHIMQECGRTDDHKDVQDALACAVVAHLYADMRDQIEDVPEKEALLSEGWIFYPRPQV